MDARLAAQRYFLLAVGDLGLANQVRADFAIFIHNKILQNLANQRLARHAKQLRQSLIAVYENAIGCKHGCALLHALQQIAVRQIRSLERVHALASGILHQKGIHAAVADGLEHLLGFFYRLDRRGGLLRIVTHLRFLDMRRKRLVGSKPFGARFLLYPGAKVKALRHS